MQRYLINSFSFFFSSSGTASNEKVQGLEHKIYKLQDELTVLHRTKGEVVILELMPCKFIIKLGGVPVFLVIYGI